MEDLKHPNIICMFDSFETDDEVVVVMEQERLSAKVDFEVTFRKSDFSKIIKDSPVLISRRQKFYDIDFPLCQVFLNSARSQ